MPLSSPRQLRAAVSAVMFSSLFGMSPAPAAETPKGSLEQIQKIVVIYLENRSFDNMFGEYRDANSVTSADSIYPQTDAKGDPLPALPTVMNTTEKPAIPDQRFPNNLPNKPFLIDEYVPQDQKTGDLVHRFYQEQMQINGGRMDRFAAISDAGGLVMGHYNTKKTVLWRYAHDYTLADNFFHAAFGGSFINHFWLVCACSPHFPKAPADMVAQLDDAGNLIKDGVVTPDHYAVNTVLSRFAPHPIPPVDVKKLLPPQDHVTIGDRLSAKGVSWAWYSGGWANALAGHPDALFQFHHQPFSYFKQFGEGTTARAEHLKDEAEMLKAIAEDKLPSVTFWKPLGDENEHPGYADVSSGDHKLGEVLAALEKSPSWTHMAILITFDENGGFWDHVAPPRGDRWGPGTRVPAVIVSPLAKKKYVDHTLYDTTSILRFIERRFALDPVGTRDAKANDLTNAFDF